MNPQQFFGPLALFSLLALSACDGSSLPASPADTATDSADVQALPDTTPATCAACSDDTDCGNGLCVRPASTPTTGICRPKCGSEGGTCLPDARCVGYEVGRSACLPTAGALSGEVSCEVVSGEAVSKCTGTVTGTFAGLAVKLNAAILQPNQWKGSAVLSLQAALTLGPVGDVNLVLLLPQALTVGKLTYGYPVPLATLHRMGTGAVQAPHLGVGAGGEVEVLAVAPVGGGETKVQFALEFTQFASPDAVCVPDGSVCIQKGVATCDACGTGYLPPVACAVGQSCQSGTCQLP
jgi:hypothetical protein